MIIIRIIGLVNGKPTHHDGRYLKAYDPEWLDKTVPDGILMRCIRTFETTNSTRDALQFSTYNEALACWKKVSPNRPVRPDGKPNRPLTAFTCEIVRL